MKESIKITALDRDADDMEVEFEFSDDAIRVVDVITGNELFSCDWSANLAPVFVRALELWPVLEQDD